MKIRKLTLLLAALVGLATSVLAQTTQTQATVARVTGAATVTLPDGSTTPLTAGMKVAQGSTITTGADGDVYLESHAGYVTSIKHDSVVAVDEISVTTEGGQVKEERTMLDLKSGNLVAKLDPKKKAVNNYQVRTPKGVAAARGTVFSVLYKGEKIAVAVVNGQVMMTGGIFEDGFTPVDAGQYITRKEKRIASNVSESQTTDDSSVPASTFSFFAKQDADHANEMREMLAAVVATIAVAAQKEIGGTTAAEAAAISKVIFTAVPSVAAQAAATMKASGVTDKTVTDAIKETVPVAEQSSFTASLSTGTFEQSNVTTNSDSRSTITTTVTTPQPIDPSTISRSNE